MEFIKLENEDLHNKKVISFYTYKDKINLNEYESEYKNVNKYENVNIDKSEIKILYIQTSDSNIYNVDINKFNNNFNNIYTVAFKDKILINLSENNNVKIYGYEFLISHSFDYEKRNLKMELEITQINMGYEIIDSYLHFYITYGFLILDKENQKHKNQIKKNEKEDKNQKNDFNYINISKEFL